ncbi:hypothetical protein SAMN05443529_11414 [Desulfosporosinus hippei DSM 8344]|uniref:Uncharacterized protein n=1 Tax=Desulfosporosinus hippei DSM 8344 TaxID=1121419 RepID=A0A1G8CS58_9FIRM|nr:hypothetical protein SAMN05443529_11414 [Desulfosporosinus hippei DSM 8344]
MQKSLRIDRKAHKSVGTWVRFIIFFAFLRDILYGYIGFSSSSKDIYSTLEGHFSVFLYRGQKYPLM